MVIAAADRRKRGRPKTRELLLPVPFPAALLRPAALVRGDKAGGEAGAAGAAVDVLCLPSPDWLKHRLTVTGPTAELAHVSGRRSRARRHSLASERG